jgi:hypothetical protein
MLPVWREWLSGSSLAWGAVPAGQAAGAERPERAIQRHDEAAALQERFGHPDRAARARKHGRQARELHQQALRELRDWAGSAPAVED